MDNQPKHEPSRGDILWWIFMLIASGLAALLSLAHTWYSALYGIGRAWVLVLTGATSTVFYALILMLAIERLIVYIKYRE